MDAILKAFLTSWNWRLDVITVVVSLGTVYTFGWWRLWKQGARIARKWQLALYWAALATICLALLSPIDTFGAFLFTMHMVQHELLVMVAPVLLLLANPLPVIFWGLPRGLRRELGRLLTQGALFRRILRALTWMPVAWLLYVATLWGWHHPTAYQLALRNEILHDVQHLSFFFTALLFWWPVVNPAPRVHGHIAYGLRIFYVFLAAGQNTLLSALLGLTERILYPYYLAVPRLFGLTALDDQAIGATVMWVPGGMMYVIATLVLLNSHFDFEERLSRQREAAASRLRSLSLVLLFLVLTAFEPSTWANGGTPRLASVKAGPYLVSVWSHPDSPRVGEQDISVAVMTPETRAPVLDAKIRLVAEPLQADRDSISAGASRGAGANKLLYHANLELPVEGRWRVTVLVDGPAGSGRATFELEAKRQYW